MKLLRYLRFSAFDVSTEDGRASERYRLAAWAILANVASKAAAMAVMVLSVSLTIPYLGAQRFGIWMTIASFAGMLTFLGLGVGNALTNHVASRSAKSDADLLRRAVSGGLGLLFLIGLAVGAALWLLAAWLPWAKLIKVDDALLLLEAQAAAKLFALLFGLNLFTTGIQSVFAGLQRSFEVYLVSALGSVASLGVLWWAAQVQAGLPVLLAATLGIQSLSLLLLLGLLVRRKLFALGKITWAVRQETSGLIRIGGLFFVLQVGTMIGWGADALIISSALGPAAVAVYSIAQRLFQFVSQPLAMMNSPLWGAYAEAHSKGDVAFIRRTFKASMWLTLGGALSGATILFFSSEWLLHYWTGGKVLVPGLLLGLVALWTVLECCGVAFAMFLNGVQVVKQQVIVVSVFCILVLPLKIWGVSSLGLIAIPLVTMLVYASTHIYFYGFVFYSKIKSFMTISN
ncbi:MAG: oligosaccharide flippase family protein [Rhodoferax sp.]|uniref:lipopolysaccharide biosynthesis protein n=1 Tax=Rhodoferax sp. TaxID=50421 RepID=UPI002616DC9E|nr:MATE family efflux transporter [Rhodoferax sp.]MDD2883274.1 oligosaccharide flippase family protein [Rhodoferax sp.]